MMITRPRPWSLCRLRPIAFGALALSLSAAAASAAHAATPTALQKCQQGALPELSQSATLGGTEVQLNYPDESDPDNAIYPGDVVKVTATGKIRVNAAGTIVAPTGNGVAAPGGWPFPGFSEYSAMANWNNNPGGWLGSSMAAASLSGCSSAPASYPVRLIYRMNDPSLSDNGGQWSFKTQVWKAPGSLIVEGLEITQGVQTAGTRSHSSRASAPSCACSCVASRTARGRWRAWARP
jgi:hypothetical protein